MREENNSLTPRETQVFELLLKLYSDKQIAQNLVITTETVRNHVSSICSKRGIGRTDRYLLVCQTLQARIDELEKKMQSTDSKVAALVDASDKLLQSVSKLCDARQDS